VQRAFTVELERTTGLKRVYAFDPRKAGADAGKCSTGKVEDGTNGEVAANWAAEARRPDGAAGFRMTCPRALGRSVQVDGSGHAVAKILIRHTPSRMMANSTYGPAERLQGDSWLDLSVSGSCGSTIRCSAGCRSGRWPPERCITRVISANAKPALGHELMCPGFQSSWRRGQRSRKIRTALCSNQFVIASSSRQWSRRRRDFPSAQSSQTTLMNWIGWPGGVSLQAMTIQHGETVRGPPIRSNDLADWQTRLNCSASTIPSNHTRMAPKRAEEMLDGGSNLLGDQAGDAGCASGIIVISARDPG